MDIKTELLKKNNLDRLIYLEVDARMNSEFNHREGTAFLRGRIIALEEDYLQVLRELSYSLHPPIQVRYDSIINYQFLVEKKHKTPAKRTEKIKTYKR